MPQNRKFFIESEEGGTCLLPNSFEVLTTEGYEGYFTKAHGGRCIPYVNSFVTSFESIVSASILTTEVHQGYFTKAHGGRCIPSVNSLVTSFESFVVPFLSNYYTRRHKIFLNDNVCPCDSVADFL